MLGLNTLFNIPNKSVQHTPIEEVVYAPGDVISFETADWRGEPVIRVGIIDAVLHNPFDLFSDTPDLRAYVIPVLDNETWGDYVDIPQILGKVVRQ